jgi:ankyrin repeat protein
MRHFNPRRACRLALGAILAALIFQAPAIAQIAPDADQLKRYTGLHAAAATGDRAAIKRLVAGGANLEQRDPHGRTPLMVAGYRHQYASASDLIKAGADLHAYDSEQYDLLTIAAVANDLKMVKLALAAGGNARAVTSPYEGTALIASAHLGHVKVVQALIERGATLDHVNNLGWTALIEAIILGDGGPRHIAIVADLVKAGADITIADGNGATPLALALQNGHQTIAQILHNAGARR